MAQHLFGMHDFSYEWVDLVKSAGKTGWSVNTEAIGCDPNDHGGKNYDTCGGVVTHITRLNNGYGSAGTIPLPDRYSDFARRCANFVAASQGCNHWIVGNEIGLAWEWPEGQRITLDNYVQCFKQVRQAIKSVQPDAVVIPQAPAPWNVEVRYDGNPGGDWVQQLPDMLNRIGAGNVDAIALHAYSHGHDAGLISDEKRMDAPFNHRRYHFRAYIEYMEAIPQAFRNLPVLITEANPDGWNDTNNGWIQTAYAEIDRWNQDGNHQPIRCLCFYRWPNEDREQFHIRSKGGVVDDFKQALQRDYRWPERTFKTGGNMSIGTAIGNAAASTKFKAGDLVVTKVAARLRNAPNASGEVVSNLDPGIHAQVTGDAQSGNGLTWWPVKVGEMQGWIAQAAPDGTVILDWDLRLHRPCNGPETQQFGERPEYYSQIQGYAVPLKGHNGLDYGVTVGSDIFAADDGYIYDIRNEDEGFGLHVLIQHAWGATLYAHLSEMLVGKGDPVTRGQVFARSGNGGAGSGPHLHFGVKVYPVDKADGWGGYSDPKLYLEA